MVAFKLVWIFSKVASKMVGSFFYPREQSSTMPALLASGPLMATTLKVVYNARNGLQGSFASGKIFLRRCGKGEKEKLQVSLCRIVTIALALAIAVRFAIAMVGEIFNRVANGTQIPQRRGLWATTTTL